MWEDILIYDVYNFQSLICYLIGRYSYRIWHNYPRNALIIWRKSKRT